MEIHDLSDGRLLHRFHQGGDRTALAELFERHRTLAYRVALSVLGNRADAEDAAQDAFVRLMRYAPAVRADGPLSGLVARMALRSAQDLARSAGSRTTREAAWGAQATPDEVDPYEVAAQRELRALVCQAVDALHERYRLPIVLHYLQGLSTRETADALGITQTAVTTRLSRGVARLRTQLQGNAKALSLAALTGLLTRSEADAAPIALASRLQALAAGASVPAPVGALTTALAHLAGGTLQAKLVTAGLAVAIGAGGLGAARHALPMVARPAPASMMARSGAPESGVRTGSSRVPVAVSAGDPGTPAPVTAQLPVRPPRGAAGIIAPPLSTRPDGRPAGTRTPGIRPAAAQPDGSAPSGSIPGEPEMDVETAAAEQAFRDAYGLVTRGDREVWPRERFRQCADAFRKVVKRWPKTRPAQQAQERLAWLMWARLDDRSASVSESQKLLELFPLSSFAEQALQNIHWQCRDWVKDPARERAIVEDYRRRLEAMARQARDEESRAAALYLTGMAGRYLGNRDSLERLAQVKERYPDSDWARRAERYLAFRQADLVARMRMFEDSEYRSRERDIEPGIPMEKQSRRGVQVNAETWDPDGAGMQYELRVSSGVAVQKADPPTHVETKGGRSIATWHFPEDTAAEWQRRPGSMNYNLSGVSQAKCPNVTVTRRSEDLRGRRRRITITVKAPMRVYVDIRPSVRGQVLGDTVSPQPDASNTAGDLFFWGGGGRMTDRERGLDCSSGKSFSFVIQLPEGVETYYPHVTVGTWRVERGDPGVNSMPRPDADFGDANAHFTSTRKCRVEWAERNIRESYVLDVVRTGQAGVALDAPRTGGKPWQSGGGKVAAAQPVDGSERHRGAAILLDESLLESSIYDRDGKWKGSRNFGQYEVCTSLAGAGYVVYSNGRPRGELTAGELKRFRLVVMNGRYGGTATPPIPEPVITDLVSYVKEGGRLLVIAAGGRLGRGQGAQFYNPLVGHFGVRFEESPRINASMDEGQAAGPLAAKGAGDFRVFSGISVDAKGGETLAYCNDEPLIVSVPYGRGRVVAAGLGASLMGALLNEHRPGGAPDARRNTKLLLGLARYALED